MTDDIRRIRVVGESTRYISLPKSWGDINDFVRVDVLNEDEIKLTRVRLVDNKKGE